MPTSAVTGTKQVQKAAAKRVPQPFPEAPVGQPLADPSGNGSVQVTCSDGSIVSVDAAQAGWEDVVRELAS